MKNNTKKFKKFPILNINDNSILGLNPKTFVINPFYMDELPIIHWHSNLIHNSNKCLLCHQ